MYIFPPRGITKLYKLQTKRGSIHEIIEKEESHNHCQIPSKNSLFRGDAAWPSLCKFLGYFSELSIIYCVFVDQNEFTK